MIAAHVAERVAQLRAELAAQVDIIATATDGSALLLVDPDDDLPAFVLLVDANRCYEPEAPRH